MYYFMSVLFHALITLFSVLGAFGIWTTAANVVAVICCVYLFITIAQCEFSWYSCLLFVGVPLICGFVLGFSVFDVGLIGSLYFSVASTIIVPMIATIFEC